MQTTVHITSADLKEMIRDAVQSHDKMDVRVLSINMTIAPNKIEHDGDPDISVDVRCELADRHTGP